MSSHADSGATAGFTLLEMLAALTVAAMLVAAAPRLVAPSAGGLAAAERLVAGELRRAREAALTEGAPRAVLFDVAAGAVRRDGAAAVALPQGVTLAVEGAREVIEARGAPGVVFFAEGGATGGAVRLQRGDAVALVTAFWLTGAIDVARP
jgi:general secretion pathway protein H